MWPKSWIAGKADVVRENARIQVEEKKGQFGPRFVVSDGERLSVDCIAVFAAESIEYLSLENAGR